MPILAVAAPGGRLGPMRRGAAVLGLAAVLAAAARGQLADLPSAPPHADPVVNADALLKADRAVAWMDGQARWLLLDGQVAFEVGTYGFRARRAVVRIEPQRLPGRLVHRLAAWLDGAGPVRGRGPVSAESDRLLVTASTWGGVGLEVNLLDQADQAPADRLVDEARERMGAYQVALARPLRSLPEGTLAAAAAGSAPPAPAAEAAWAAAAAEPEPGAAAGPGRLITGRGVVSVDWGQIVYRPAEDGHLVMLTGGVSVVFSSEGDRPGRRVDVNLTCQNAVIFLAEGAELVPGARRFDAGKVRGVYLEDNVVVTNGQYTVRAPRVFYDPATERAVLLDAVFYTWDAKRQVPIYVRAQELRQHSMRSWSARDALLTTSEFAQPHFAIAASRVNVDLRDRADGTRTLHAEAADIVPRAGDLPVGWWPGFEGEAGDIPLRRVDTGYSENRGPVLRTTWDMFGLLQRPRPAGVDLTGQVDYVGDHGPATGLNLDYDQPEMFGTVDSYLVPHDEGTDEIADRDKDHDGDVRGFLHGQHRQYLTDDWELSLEGSYVSDPTFLEEFFPDEADTARPYETSVYLKNQHDEEQFSVLAQYELLDFTPQTTVLQSPGYTVEKLPELGYHRVGTSLLGDRLSYFTENRLTRMRVRAGRDSPRDRGFSMQESLLTFARPNTVDFDDAADAAGIPGDHVDRIDTRHELQAPLKLAIVDVLPYVAGRSTFYDDDFEAYAGEEDQHRLWGTAGARLHTSFSQTHEGVENSVLDLHRLRHLVEPEVDVYAIESTLDPADIPVYDPEVEAIRQGAGSRLGLRNTLQTERGGPGRWHNVDWLVVNTDLILGDEQEQVPLARFFSYRPEYSTGGDHVYTDVAWTLSDTLALTADLTHDLERDGLADLHGGTQITHSPNLTSYVEYESLDALSSRLLSLGCTYQLTRKYRLGANQRWDLEARDSQRTEVVLERKLPRWTLMVVAAFDDIDDDRSIGVVLIPDGVRSARRLRSAGP